MRVPVTAGRREVAVTFLDKAGVAPERQARAVPAAVSARPQYPRRALRLVLAPRRDQRAVRRDGARAHGEPRAHLRVPARSRTQPTATPEAESCAKTILASLARRAYRRPVADADVAPLRRFLSRRARRARQLRRRHPGRAESLAREPRVPVPRGSAIRRTRRRARCTASATSSSRRGCRSSYGAASPTTSCCAPPSAARLRKPARARAASAAHDRRPARRCVRRQLRRPVAVPAQPRSRDPGAEHLSELRRYAARRPAARDGAVLRERAARGPQRARAAGRRLHVRQRARRAALRHCRT